MVSMASFALAPTSSNLGFKPIPKRARSNKTPIKIPVKELQAHMQSFLKEVHLKLMTKLTRQRSFGRNTAPGKGKPIQLLAEQLPKGMQLPSRVNKKDYLRRRGVEIVGTKDLLKKRKKQRHCSLCCRKCQTVMRRTLPKSKIKDLPTLHVYSKTRTCAIEELRINLKTLLPSEHFVSGKIDHTRRKRIEFLEGLREKRLARRREIEDVTKSSSMKAKLS